MTWERCPNCWRLKGRPEQPGGCMFDECVTCQTCGSHGELDEGKEHRVHGWECGTCVAFYS